MRFASLGSGSEGNGLVVEVTNGQTVSRALLDCGFTLKESEKRLARLGLDPGMLDAILVTHEHGDHSDGVIKLARRYHIPIWASHGTLSTFSSRELAKLSTNVCCSHTPFSIGNLQVHPFPVPHDAREPTQFVFSNGLMRLGVLTDVGRPTAHIIAMLNGCHALVLECNHDTDLLKNSSYPASLKKRIGGAYGHLANHSAAQILARVDRSSLRHLIAAHLSQSNNTPELARQALAAVCELQPHEIGVANQENGFDWIDLN